MAFVLLGVFVGYVGRMWGVVGARNLCYIGYDSLKNWGSTPPQVIGILDVF
jgi:hypothetical protein